MHKEDWIQTWQEVITQAKDDAKNGYVTAKFRFNPLYRNAFADEQTKLRAMRLVHYYSELYRTNSIN